MVSPASIDASLRFEAESESRRSRWRRSRELRAMCGRLALLDRLLTKPTVMGLLTIDDAFVRRDAGMQRLCIERAGQLRTAVSAAMDTMHALRRCPLLRD